MNETKTYNEVNKVNVDVGIVGAGVLGLLLAKKLGDLGYRIALIEKSKTLANGPSTRNHGWLHRGTYHSATLEKEDEAKRVTERLIYGYEQIKNYAPESIEEPSVSMFTIVKTDETAHKAVSRWKENGILFRPIHLGRFQELNPEINTNEIKHVFQVADLSINNRIFFQKLLTDIMRNGAKIFTNTNFIPENDNFATLQTPNGNLNLKANSFIITNGYGMRELFSEIVGEDLPMRYWKSHLLVFPRLTQNSLFNLEPMGSTIIQHRDHTIAGLHEDAVLLDSPDFQTNPKQANQVFQITQNLIPHVAQYEKQYLAIACIKPDIAHTIGARRSVDIKILQPKKNYIFAIPGKMTEAPYVADEIVRMIFNNNSSELITLRPCDMFEIMTKS